MTLTSSEVQRSTQLFEIKRGKFVSHQALIKFLPDAETALFFAKAYKLDQRRLTELLRIVLPNNTLLQVLNEGGHSDQLQDYLVDTVPDILPTSFRINTGPVHAEILPELWASFETVVAKSIQDVADKLAGTLDLLPGKEGEMVFRHLAKLNKQRPTIGRFSPVIHHALRAPNLVVFDVSGSMTEGTVRKLVNEVVGLAVKADAHLAIVSNDAFWWEPGAYDVDSVLAKAQYGGTQYEKLTPVFQQDWGTVITIADYDSSRSAQQWLKSHGRSKVGTVLDISLVNRVSFLAECIGQFADELKPLLVGSTSYVLS